MTFKGRVFEGSTNPRLSEGRQSRALQRPCLLITRDVEQTVLMILSLHNNPGD